MATVVGKFEDLDRRYVVTEKRSTSFLDRFCRPSRTITKHFPVLRWPITSTAAPVTVKTTKLKPKNGIGIPYLAPSPLEIFERPKNQLRTASGVYVLLGRRVALVVTVGGGRTGVVRSGKKRRARVTDVASLGESERRGLRVFAWKSEEIPPSRDRVSLQQAVRRKAKRMSATMDNNNRNEKSEGIAAATDDGRDENGCARNSAAILESPSLAHALVTTVPQNITARALGDKHTPTRNSLRHSRMIVMNRNGKTPRHYLPFVIRHYKIVKSMKVMTILLAVAMCLISVWLVLWTPTMSAADYPYWSAVPALCSGIVGCLFLGCCPRPYPGRRLSWTYHYVKFLSVSTTVISIASIVLVLTFALIHVTYLYSSTCESFDKLNKTCVCAPGGATSAVFNDVYHYEDLTCDEVEQFLRDLEISTCAVNFVMLVLEISYLYVHWTDRDLAGFSRVPARDPVKSDGS